MVAELQIEPAEVQWVSREATIGQRRLIALNCVGLGLSLAAIAENYFEGQSLMKSALLPGLFCVVACASLVTLNTARRRRIATIQRSQPPGAAVSYELDGSGIQIRGAAGATRVSWAECKRFDESAHAFLLYAGSFDPEIVHKRAFGEEQLTAIREQLRANVKPRDAGRALALTVLMGVGLLALGVIVAIAARGAGH